MYKHLLAAVLLFNCFTAQAQSRMVAKFEYYYDKNAGVDKLSNSATYAYSNGRGGAVGKPLNYDTSMEYATTEEDGTIPQFRHVQHFNVLGLIDVHDQYYWDKNKSPRKGWLDWAKYKFSYDARGQMIADTIYGGTSGPVAPLAAITINYNALNQVTDSFLFKCYDDIPTWDTQYHYRFTYDGLGRRQSELMRGDSQKIRMADVSLTTYTYKGNTNLISYMAVEGLVIMGGWSKIYDIAYAYNVNNTLQQQYRLAYHTSQTVPDTESRINYYYDANDLLVQEEGYDYVPQTNGWILRTNKEYTNNADGNRTSYRLQNWDDNTNQYVNSFSQRYYYQLFFPVNVAQLPQQGGTLQLYPVPANNTLNVTINWDAPQPYNLTIADMQGRVTMQYNSNNANQTIDVSALPAGVYNIVLKGDKGGVQHSKFSVVR